MNRQYVKSSISNFKKVNEEFVKCTISVLSCEQIANGTKFTKEGVDKALPTLNYAPVVGYYNGENFEGHGQEVVLTSDGNVEFRVKTIPFGCVISDSQRWEKIQKPNGEYEEYLVVDAYMWSRYSEAVDKVIEGKCNQSMEILALNGEYKENYYEIKDFDFSALCILGDDVAPAFNLAKIRTSDTFSRNEFEACYEEMLTRFKYTLENLEKGGAKVEENKFENEIILNDEVEPSNDEFENKDEVKNEEVKENIECSESEEDKDNEEDKEDKEDDDEEMAKKRKKCSKCDSDTNDENYSENEEVICAKCEEEFSNKVEIDKQEYSELVSIKAEYNTLSQEHNELKVKYADITSENINMSEELKELKEFKTNIERAEFENEIDAVIREFEELKDIEGFNEIFKNKYNYSSEDLRKTLKIFAYDNGVIIGKKKVFSKKENVVKIPVGETKNESISPYGGLLDKYIK